MATAYGGFQLGLLPERKINKRAMATATASCLLLLIIVINLGLFCRKSCSSSQYHVTELIPHALVAAGTGAHSSRSRQLKPKLLPAVKLPVFEQPKLVVPREVRREAPQPVEAPKVVVNQFSAAAVEDGGQAARVRNWCTPEISVAARRRRR